MQAVSAWLKRFGLHTAAAIGATSIFVGAAAVGAHQTHQQTLASGPVVSPTPAAGRKPTPPVVISPAPVFVRTPGPTSPSPPLAAAPMAASPPPGTRAGPPPMAPSAPTPEKVVPERSLAGTIVDVLPDGLDVLGVGGREWRVSPAPGALIRLNGKPAHLDALRTGNTVVILGQAQAQAEDRPGYRFLAHAITARTNK